MNLAFFNLQTLRGEKVPLLDWESRPRYNGLPID